MNVTTRAVLTVNAAKSRRMNTTEIRNVNNSSKRLYSKEMDKLSSYHNNAYGYSMCKRETRSDIK